MSRRVFFRDSEAQGFTTYGLLLDTLFRQLKTVGIAGYFPYEYHEDMSCDYAELVSFFGEEFGRLAEQEADASNLSILSKHVSLRGILLERYRKDNERYLAARNSLSIGRLKKVEDKNEPSWAELVASAENEDKKESEEAAEESEGAEDTEDTEGAGIQDSDRGQQNSAAMNSFLAAIKGAHAVDDSVAPEYIEEDDEEPVSGYSSEEDWGEDEDPSVLPADEDEEEVEEDSEEDEGYDVLPADDDEEEDPGVLPDDEDEGYSSELPEDEDEEEYSSELPADEEDESGYSSELPADDDEEDSSVLPDDEDDEEYSSELPADDDEEDSSELPADDDDNEEYSSELPADEDEDEDSGYSSELPEDDDEDYSSELPEDDDDDYSSELPNDDDDDEDYSSELPDDEDSGVLPDDDDEPESFKSAPQPKSYTSPMMSYSAPVSSMVVRPSYARGIPGRETQEAVLDMMNKLANNIKGWFSRL